MNSQQRRKEKRRRMNNAKFEMKSLVRIHHKYEDDQYIDTFKSRVVTGIQWSASEKDLLYELDNDNMFFPESYLIPDTKEDKRKIF